MQYMPVNLKIKIQLKPCRTSYFCDSDCHCASHNSQYFPGEGATTRQSGKKIMTSKLKLAFIAAAALTCIASPALAQSAWTTGTASNRARAGYFSPYGNSAYAYVPRGASRRSSGLGAYAMVPRSGGGDRYSPAANGGGNSGYNWAVENDQ
jgi:hypothetical protein